MDTRIQHIREKINRIDDQILDLLIRRQILSREMGDIKRDKNLKINDRDRERQIIQRLSSQAGNKLSGEQIERIFSRIFQSSKSQQE